MIPIGQDGLEVGSSPRFIARRVGLRLKFTSRGLGVESGDVPQTCEEQE